jgi:hypothetical protein
MKQKSEFNWRLYEFSREELGLSTLSHDALVGPRTDEGHRPNNPDEMQGREPRV